MILHLDFVIFFLIESGCFLVYIVHSILIKKAIEEKAMRYYSKRRGHCEVPTVIIKRTKHGEPKTSRQSVRIVAIDGKPYDPDLTPVVDMSQAQIREQYVQEDQRFDKLVSALFNQASRAMGFQRLLAGQIMGLTPAPKLVERHSKKAADAIEWASLAAYAEKKGRSVW